jgi:hypothetical protein
VNWEDEPTVELPIVVPAHRGPRRLAFAVAAAALMLVIVAIVRSGEAPPTARPPKPGWHPGTVRQDTVAHFTDLHRPPGHADPRLSR